MGDITEFTARLKTESLTAEFRTMEPMSSHTSFRIGGPAALMVFPKSEAELLQILALAKACGVCPAIMGNGTDLLCGDGPLELAVIKTTAIAGISLTGDGELTAGCGALLSRIASFALEHGLGGFEFASGIPGTLGGALLMNAGAYGGEMKDVTVSVRAAAPDSTIREYQNADCGFGYRASRFSESDETILSAVLRLRPADPAEIRASMDDLSARRREKQPLNLPSAGSAFKRPAGGYAAALIEEAGLKGRSVGGAQVSPKHAGFLVNTGGATFQDMMALIKIVQDEVYRRSGILLEPEVRIWADAGGQQEGE